MTTFYKFHGAGNDFILIDNRDHVDFSENQIAHLCHRRLGIGADGFITLSQPSIEGASFSMQYYNADGKLASLCGNGSRCITAFAHYLGLTDKCVQFEAFDGLHTAQIIDRMDKTHWMVEVEMRLNSGIMLFEDGCFLDTGSPHFVKYVTDIHNFDVYNIGKQIRHETRFPEGCNVNFIEKEGFSVFVRTFERGVEDETLSCGTGVTASAIVYSLGLPSTQVDFTIPISTRGGDFQVHFRKEDDKFSNITLLGPATLAFIGTF